jgi:hypothetical protein
MDASSRHISVLRGSITALWPYLKTAISIHLLECIAWCLIWLDIIEYEAWVWAPYLTIISVALIVWITVSIAFFPMFVTHDAHTYALHTHVKDIHFDFHDRHDRKAMQIRHQARMIRQALRRDPSQLSWWLRPCWYIVDLPNLIRQCCKSCKQRLGCNRIKQKNDTDEDFHDSFASDDDNADQRLLHHTRHPISPRDIPKPGVMLAHALENAFDTEHPLSIDEWKRQDKNRACCFRFRIDNLRWSAVTRRTETYIQVQLYAVWISLVLDSVVFFYPTWFRVAIGTIMCCGHLWSLHALLQAKWLNHYWFRAWDEGNEQFSSWNTSDYFTHIQYFFYDFAIACGWISVLSTLLYVGWSTNLTDSFESHTNTDLVLVRNILLTLVWLIALCLWFHASVSRYLWVVHDSTRRRMIANLVIWLTSALALTTVSEGVVSPVPYILDHAYVRGNTAVFSGTISYVSIVTLVWVVYGILYWLWMQDSRPNENAHELAHLRQRLQQAQITWSKTVECK